MGNEAADKEARRAAEGKTSDKSSLPPYLRKPLPTNPSAVKRAHHVKLKKKWEEAWRASDRGKYVLRYDSASPSSKFLKAISHKVLSRNAASRIAQFKLMHAPRSARQPIPQTHRKGGQCNVSGVRR